MYGQKEWCGNDQNHFTKSVKERYEYCNEIEQWTHTLPSRDAVSDRTPPQTWRSSTTAPPSLLQQKPAASVLPKVAPASTRVAKSHHVGRQATAYGSSHQIEVSSKFRPDACNRWLFKITTSDGPTSATFCKTTSRHICKATTEH